MTNEAGPESSWTVGSLADEATQLLAAARKWAEQQSAHTGKAPESREGNVDSPCHLCPICQVISLVRKTHPEVIEQLGTTTEAVMAAVRSSILSHEKQWESGPAQRVQHIDIDVED